MLKRFFQRKPAKDLSCEIINSGFAFDLEKKATILQSALSAGVSLPHNCQVGSCKECCCKLVEGEIKSHVELDYLFDKSEIDDGYFLPCQSVAKSNVIIETLESTDLKVPDVSATIESVIDLSPRIKRLIVKSDIPIKPKPGQYSNLTIPQLNQYRSYSFSDQDDANQRYTFDITLHPQGQVSNWLLCSNKVGECVELSAPRGDFSLTDSSGPLLCIAAGSGQGAILNIIKQNSQELLGRKILFMCSTKTMKEQYCQSAITDLSETLNIKYTPYLTQAEMNGATLSTYKEGRIPPQLEPELRAWVDKSNEDIDFSQWSVLLCGAPGLIDDCLKVLDHMGFSKKNISYDKYEASGG